MATIGEATIAIIPDAKGFSKALSDQLKREKPPEIEPKVSPKSDPRATDQATQGIATRINSSLQRAIKPIKVAFDADAMQAKLREVGSRARQMGRTVSLATAPIGIALAAGTREAQNIELALREVNTLSGLTGTEAAANFDSMRDSIARLSQETGLAQENLVSGLYDSLSAGVPADNVFTFLETSAQLGVAGVTDTQTAVDGLTTVINAFGKEAGDASIVSDQIFTAMKLGKQNVEEISSSLFQVAGAANAAGVDFDNVAAAMATLTSKGTPARVATTQLRQAILSTQAPTAEMQDAFDELGVKGFDELLKKSGSMQEAFIALSGTAGDNAELKKMFGSVEALQAVLSMTGGNADDARQALAQMGEAAGATATGFAEVDQSRGFERFTNTIKNLSITFGNVFLPLLQPAAERLGQLVERFQDLSPTIQRFIAFAAAGVVALGPLLIGFGLFATLLGSISAAAVGWVAAITAGIGILVALAAKVKDNQAVMTQLQNAFNTVRDAFMGMVDNVREGLAGFAAAFQESFAANESTINDGLSFIRSFGEVVAGVITYAGELFRDFAPIIGKYLGFVAKVFVKVGKVVGFFIDIIRENEGILTALKIALAGVVGVFIVMNAPITAAIAAAVILAKTLTDLWNNSVNFRAAIETVIITLQIFGNTFIAIGQAIWSALSYAYGFVRDVFWPGVSAVFSAVWGIVSNTVGLIVNIFQGDWKAALDNAWKLAKNFGKLLLNLFGQIPLLILRLVNKLVPGLRKIAGDAMRALFTKVLEAWPAIRDWFSRVPGMIGNALGALAETLRAKFHAAMNRAFTAIKNIGQFILNWYKDLPGKIIRMLGSVGKLLYDAGYAIINGLWDGMKAAWKKVADWLGGLGSKIKSLKGPIEVDRQLLVPEGSAIMDGFGEGLRAGWAPVAGWLDNVGSTMKGIIGTKDVMKIAADAVLGVSVNPVEALNKLVPEVPRRSTGLSDTQNQAAQLARMFGAIVTNTYRSPAYNAAIGGAPNSWHTHGLAADFSTGNPLGDGRLDSMYRYLKKFLGKTLVELLWRTTGHYDHLHAAWYRSLPRRERGGRVEGREPHIIGEAGPELFIPSKSGYVISNKDAALLVEDARQRLQGRGPAGDTFNMTVQSMSPDPTVIAHRTLATIEDARRRRARP